MPEALGILGVDSGESILLLFFFFVVAHKFMGL
jgi:hypothetical protein